MNKKTLLSYIIPNKIIQYRKHSRNRVALKILFKLGFDMPEIRHALLALNNIKSKDLINGHEISASTLYNTLKGLRDNDQAKQLIAEALGLRVAELWPD